MPTRERSLPEQYIPDIKVAVEGAGLDWGKFQLTDNSCPLHPPTKAPLEEIVDDIQGVSLSPESFESTGMLTKAAI